MGINDEPPKSNTSKPDTPEIIEVHLNADKNLSPETRDALVELLSAAYEQFTNSDHTQ